MSASSCRLPFLTQILYLVVRVDSAVNTTEFIDWRNADARLILDETANHKQRAIQMYKKAQDLLLGDVYRDFLGYSLAFVFFYYLVVFACVAPSPALTCAVAFEICVYIAFLAYRINRRAAKSGDARRSVGAALILTIPGGYKLTRWFAAFIAVSGTALLFCALVDAFSFGFAAAGQNQAATFMYSRFPVSVLAGVNPGYTMELLSGAQMKAGRYADVEGLYKALYKVRERHFGARSEKICEIYADFGDLAERGGNNAKAEQLYVYAINLSNEIKVPQGCGKYLTKLGLLQAQQGKFDQALKNLAEAKSMRSRIFGPDSQKVADTLLATAKVHRLMGDDDGAKTLAEEASAILRALPKQEVNLALYSAFVSMFLMSSVYLLTGKNGLLTSLAVSRLQKAIVDERVSEVRKIELKSHLGVLKQYTASTKSGAQAARKDHEAAKLSLLILLTSQDLR